MTRRLLVVTALLFVFASQPARSPGDTYLAYAKAVEAGSIADAKRYISAEKQKQIASMSDAEAHAQLDVLSPKHGLEVSKEEIDGNDAVVTVTARIGEDEASPATGTIKLTKEKGEWRVRSEMWNIGEPETATNAYTPKNLNPAQKAAWRKIEDAGYPDPSPDQFLNAAAHNDRAVVKLFLEAGFEVDTVSGDHTPFYIAALLGHDELALYLLEEGANVDFEDEVHTTALMRSASRCESTKLIKALLAKGARTDVKSAGGATAEELAHFSNCEENEKLIRAAAAKKKTKK